MGNTDIGVPMFAEALDLSFKLCHAQGSEALSFTGFGRRIGGCQALCENQLLSILGSLGYSLLSPRKLCRDVVICA